MTPDIQASTGERGLFVLLTRTFFGRFFDSELLTTRGASPAILWLAAFIATPGLLSPAGSFAKYAWLATRPIDMRIAWAWPDKLFYLSWTMMTTGVVTVLAWEALLPDRRDCLILHALPVRSRTTASARLAALGLFFLVMLAAANAVSWLTYPAVATEARLPISLSRYLFAHVVSITAASGFVFFGLLLVQILLVSLVEPRWFRRAATVAQVGSVMLVLLFLVRPAIPIAVWVRGEAAATWMDWAPPLWFLGLYETLLGTNGLSSRPTTVLYDAAMRGVWAFGFVTIGALVLYLSTYGRHVRRLIESPETMPRRGRRSRSTSALSSARGRAWSAIDRWIDRVQPASIERACVAFIAKTLARSPTHRLIVSGYVGVGLVIVIAGVTPMWVRREHVLATPAVNELAIPLILSFFAFVGMRVAFAKPMEPSANWSFRITETSDRHAYVAGVRRALWLFGGVVPVACAWPFYAVLWGPLIATAHAWCCLLLARLLSAIIVSGFPRMPFTFVPLPGSSNVKAWWPVYVTAFSVYAYTLPGLERNWFTSPSRALRVLIAAAILEIAWRVAMRLASRVWKRASTYEPDAALVYDDEGDAMVELRITG